jgi:hypothetical protein
MPFSAHVVLDDSAAWEVFLLTRASRRKSELHFSREYERFWLVGLALDEAGNISGIEKPPEDWS